MFTCLHCRAKVKAAALGTRHRNHCPFCLFSRHLDQTAGDRAAACRGMMAPIGLVFKKEGRDRWGRPRQGELMLVHHCQICGKISLNRIAGDDDPRLILKLIPARLPLSFRQKLAKTGLTLLKEKDRPEAKRQLFGKTD